MVVAFGALFLYPVFLAVVAGAPIAQRATFPHAQIAFSKRVTGPTIGVILLAGVYLATDAELWSKVWVTVPFVLLFVIAGLGATLLRRGEEALAATSEAGDEAAYAAALATVRTWTYVTPRADRDHDLLHDRQAVHLGVALRLVQHRQRVAGRVLEPGDVRARTRARCPSRPAGRPPRNAGTRTPRSVSVSTVASISSTEKFQDHLVADTATRG